MTDPRDVIEYIVVPPFAKRDRVVASKERLEHYLGNRFPGNSFKVARFAPVGDESEFYILPIMNFVGDDGKSYMCREPRRWFMQEVAQACREFDFEASPRHSGFSSLSSCPERHHDQRAG